MPVIAANLSALAIGLIYYAYRDVYIARACRDRVQRERVAYMLWMAASRMP